MRGIVWTWVRGTTPPGSSIGPGGPCGSIGGTPAQSSTVTRYLVKRDDMSRKKRPGPAFTIEESVPDDSRLIDVTNLPPCLLTVTPKTRRRGLFVSSVVVTRNDSPLMLNTGDCLSPLPLIVFTTRAGTLRIWTRCVLVSS